MDRYLFDSRSIAAPLETIMSRTLFEIYPGRLSVNTAEAAHALGRKPQTLRKWATYETGPIQPRRVSGRLAWRIADLQKLLE